MSWFQIFLLLVIFCVFTKGAPNVVSISPEISESTESTDPELTRQLSDMELELFSKLLSPNDTTLQQGTKSLLAKYVIAQIINDRKSGLTELVGSTTDTNLEPLTEKTSVKQESSTKLAPVAELAAGESTREESTTVRVTRITPAPAHVLGQVDKILGNVATGNIIGIVDESLAIRAPAPVRTLVNGILRLVFCNPIDRLMSRCRGSSPALSAGGGGGGALPLQNAASTRRTIFGK